jgi:hypothetical protein
VAGVDATSYVVFIYLFIYYASLLTKKRVLYRLVRSAPLFEQHTYAPPPPPTSLPLSHLPAL